MIIGLFLFALGIVIIIRANIGAAPWDVLHTGLAYTAGLSIGTANIITGITIVILVKLLGEKLGIGIIANMFLIGIFVDIILFIDVIPKMDNIIFALPMLIIGAFSISIGSYFYLKSAFGAGPRDSLMIVLARKTKMPAGLCRSIIELLATAAGWLLGGMIGLGTIIFVIGIGFCIQITFRFFRFDVTAVKHESFADTFASFKKK